MQRRPFGGKAGGWSRRLAGRALRLIVRAIREAQLRRAIRDMQRLDERLLQDIGLSRSSLEHAVRYDRERDLVQVRARFFGGGL
jgi:uncharacterized protein YjiS (DUF1127 family)